MERYKNAFARTRDHYIRVRLRNRQRANRRAFEIWVADVVPEMAAIGRFPDTAANPAKEKGHALGGMSDDSGYTSAAIRDRADASAFHPEHRFQANLVALISLTAIQYQQVTQHGRG